jgi:Tfp pilus assembly ATPase PilU
MQTNSGRGMQTLEQALSELTLRGVITKEIAMGASSRPAQLEGLLERAGFEDPNAPAEDSAPALRIAGGPLL